MSATNPTAPASIASAIGPASNANWTTPLVKFVFAYWTLTMFYPELFLSATIGGPWFRIPTLLMPVLLYIAMQAGFGRVQYWPFSVLMVLHMYAAVYASNRGFSVIGFKVLLSFYLLMAASIACIRTPAQVVLLLKLFMWSFVWLAAFGIPGGLVPWHAQLANEDGFGPLMGMGIGLFYFIAMGAHEKRLKWTAYAVASISVVGVVASFARGAVIAAGVVVLGIWLRSPRKLVTLAGGVVAAGVFVVSSNVLFPSGAFWEEMSTVSEGTEGGTGQARYLMWMMAVDIWQDAPIIGVGAGNFGVVASQTVTYDMDRGQWQDPAQLYNQGLHSVYFQLLAESGIVGCCLWAFMLYDFHTKIFRLRKERAGQRWRDRGGTIELRHLATGLESAMICFHVNGVFYNQFYIHWFWTLMTLSLVLTHITSPDNSASELGSASDALSR